MNEQVSHRTASASWTSTRRSPRWSITTVCPGTRRQECPDDVGPQVNTAIRDVSRLAAARRGSEGVRRRADRVLPARQRAGSCRGAVRPARICGAGRPRSRVRWAGVALSASASRREPRSLRILDGPVSLRNGRRPPGHGGVPHAWCAARTERLVDELGTAGGPRVEVVDNYFQSLTGTAESRTRRQRRHRSRTVRRLA